MLNTIFINKIMQGNAKQIIKNIQTDQEHPKIGGDHQ